jgi:hypothetical protein
MIILMHLFRCPGCGTLRESRIINLPLNARSLKQMGLDAKEDEWCFTVCVGAVGCGMVCLVNDKGQTRPLPQRLWAKTREIFGPEMDKIRPLVEETYRRHFG